MSEFYDRLVSQAAKAIMETTGYSGDIANRQAQAAVQSTLKMLAEPTPEMANIGGESIPWKDGLCGEQSETAKHVFQAMLKAIR